MADTGSILSDSSHGRRRRQVECGEVIVSLEIDLHDAVNRAIHKSIMGDTPNIFEAIENHSDIEQRDVIGKDHVTSVIEIIRSTVRQSVP